MPLRLYIFAHFTVFSNLIYRTLAASQPVLCRKEKDTWFPGHISAVSYQPNSTKTPESAIYDVTLDAAPGFEPEVCQATTASLAMAVSALELKQKYPVGARVVCKLYGLSEMLVLHYSTILQQMEYFE